MNIEFHRFATCNKQSRSIHLRTIAFNRLIPYLGEKNSMPLTGRLKDFSMVRNRSVEVRLLGVICFCVHLIAIKQKNFIWVHYWLGLTKIKFWGEKGPVNNHIYNIL